MKNELCILKDNKLSPDIEKFYSQFYNEKWDFQYRGGDEYCRKYLEQYSLDKFLLSVAFGGIPPSEGLPIHLDPGERTYTLLYGLKNKEYLEWIYYEVTPGASLVGKYNKSGVFYSEFEESTIVGPLETQTLDKNFIGNIKVPHTVINHSKDEFAYFVTMRLAKELNLEEMSHIFE